MKIIKLISENVKRLHAVEIAPEGDVVVVGGNNDQGKSSVLDSIAYALAGQGAVCDEPVRRGEAKARIVCELDDCIVTRTFTAKGGGTLTITSKDGKAKYSSPQKMLDEIVGRLSFDPLEFSRQNPAVQLETLRTLLGLDFTKIDQGIAAVYQERTNANRDVKSLEAQITAAPEYPDAPASEVSVSELMGKLEKAQTFNSGITDKENQRGDLLSEAEDHNQEMREAETRILSLKRQIESLKLQIEETEKKIGEEEKKIGDELARANESADAAKEITATLADVKPVNLAPIRNEIAAADGVNRKVRSNIARKALRDQLAKAKKLSDDLTAKIETLEAEKKNAITSAKFPVSGLGLGDTGVTFGGIPFSQASSSGQLKVSLAMGIAMNPKLKVMLIRDGSLLDDSSMKIISEMAANSGTQVWIERVSSDADKCQVIIEDGAVKGEVSNA